MTSIKPKYSVDSSKIVDGSIHAIGNTPLVDLSQMTPGSKVKIFGKLAEK